MEYNCGDLVGPGMQLAREKLGFETCLRSCRDWASVQKSEDAQKPEHVLFDSSCNVYLIFLFDISHSSCPI